MLFQMAHLKDVQHSVVSDCEALNGTMIKRHVDLFLMPIEVVILVLRMIDERCTVLMEPQNSA